MAGVEGTSAPSIGIDPVFVVGVPRSGTTWIQRMLVMHPDAWGLLETYMFSRRIGLGAVLGAVPSAPQVGDYDLPPPGLGRVFARDELVAELRTIAGRWLAHGSDGSRFVIEKSPWHLSDVDLIAEVLPEARFIHVMRDGRDVAVSTVAARGTWSRFGQRSPRAIVSEVAGLWSDAMGQRETAQVLLGERMLEVRYEEVRSDPSAACERMLAHCRMPHDQRLVTTIAEASEFGRADRPHGEDRPARAGKTGEWREAFGMREARSFERIAGTALREMGYESDRGWWRRCRLRSRF
jgi:hypothetical protein